MDKEVRKRLEMVVRVRDFHRAHPFTEPSHAAVVARFDEGLGRLQAAAVQEQAGRLEVRSATGNRKQTRRALQQELMRYLSRVAGVAAQEHPELAGRFASPGKNASHAVLLARAADMLNLAKENQEVLGEFGLAGTQLDDLAATITRFESATERANAGRRGHVGARAELLRATAELMDGIGLLDVLNRTRYRDDPVLLAEWESARNVAGPFRAPADPGQSGATPPAGPNVGKAA